MSNSIRLHKQHGLNPTLCTCFYCGQETGEIALLGAAYDGEAPCTFAQASNLVPLAKKKFKDAVLILEARPDEHDKLQPTGRWVAVKKDAVKRS